MAGGSGLGGIGVPGGLPQHSIPSLPTGGHNTTEATAGRLQKAQAQLSLAQRLGLQLRRRRAGAAESQAGGERTVSLG